jgi:hypothetical protein
MAKGDWLLTASITEKTDSIPAEGAVLSLGVFAQGTVLGHASERR